MDTPVELIVAAFPNETDAGRLLDDLKLGRLVGIIGIRDAAAVIKDADGKLKITNAKHRTRRGMFTGGAIGGAIALLSGPIGWGAVAGGGVIGALASRMRGAPMRAELTDLAESLTPGSSALIAVVEHRWVSQLAAHLEAAKAQIVREELKADIAAQLEAGGNVVFSSVSSDDGDALTRIAADDEGIEVTAISDDGVLVLEAALTDEPLPAIEVGDSDGSDVDASDVEAADDPDTTT